MYQVKRLFIQHSVAKQFFRNVQPPSLQRKPVKALYPLQSRGIIKVSGTDSPVFLQGLITNDMQHFEEGASSMYAMFLNNKGRVLFDTLIYKWEGNDSFLLECDKSICAALQKHLKIYKLKRNVEIGDLSDKLRLYALISADEVNVDTTIDAKKNVNIYKDPRLADLGHRIIVTSETDSKYLDHTLGDTNIMSNEETGYKYLRYKLGVSEGAEDLAPGATFPLEANCDYLHGVSFHKGCYIGQELTARVHHTGVVRKRIMPLRFIDIMDEQVEQDTAILAEDSKKTNVGKFKNIVNDYGIGLVRIKEALEAKKLKIGKYYVEVAKPSWWPIEAPKEKVTTKVEITE